MGWKDPIPPYSDFFCGSDEKERIWRRFEIDEKGTRDIFLNMERLKISLGIILDNVNLLKLTNQNYIDTYFPLHEYY